MSDGTDETDEAGSAAGAPLDSLYREHWAQLCDYVRRNFGGGPPDPEDVAQAAFMRMSGFKGAVDNVRAFLRHAARNIVIDHHRSDLRSARLLKDASILDGSTADFSAEDVLSSKEELEALNVAIASLPSKERTALLMHRVDGASFVDIAKHLGVSQSGARYLVSQAFERCIYFLEKRT